MTSLLGIPTCERVECRRGEFRNDIYLTAHIDLVVTLYSPKTKNNYVGSNRRNRNTLNLINIPADNYTLRFYEPTANVPEAVGCSEFTFSIYIEPYSTYILSSSLLSVFLFILQLLWPPAKYCRRKVHCRVLPPTDSWFHSLPKCKQQSAYCKRLLYVWWLRSPWEHNFHSERGI